MVTGVNDGDKSLVCADSTVIKAAERNCQDVVPLVYPMAKAGAAPITPEAKYNGMVAAWTGGNIGQLSNAISCIWASPDPDVDAVKILVMQNNFVIDQLVAWRSDASVKTQNVLEPPESRQHRSVTV